jgi:small conductance mechanosensitive channel
MGANDTLPRFMQQLVQFFRELSQEDYRRLVFPFLHLLTIFVLGILLLRLIDSTLRRVARIVPTDDVHRARLEHRTETLRHFVRSFGKVVLGVVMIVLIAIDLNLWSDLTPLLASAGIAGLAIGFGAQSLVKDFISGFFVLLEDQYGVGETIRIGSQEGVVEGMTLRVTVLRNASGEMHVIPNGSVQTVTVLSRGWRRALVDVEVLPKEEIGRVYGVLSAINDELAKTMQGSILEKPSIVGIERMTGTGVTIRLVVRALATKEGDVVHTWRRMIKETFDREGIHMAASPLIAQQISPPG